MNLYSRTKERKDITHSQRNTHTRAYIKFNENNEKTLKRFKYFIFQCFFFTPLIVIRFQEILIEFKAKETKILELKHAREENKTHISILTSNIKVNK